MNTKSEWQAANQQLMADARRKVGGPPSVEKLLAYTRGELPAEEEARVREQLLAYPELVRMLTEPFPTEGAQPGDADFLPDEEFANHWTSLQSRITRNGRGARVLQFWRFSAAAAAMIALVLGAALWVNIARVDEPRIVGGEQVLLPGGRRGPESQPQLLTAQGDTFLLSVPLHGAQTFGRYRLEINNRATARAIWTIDGVQPRDDEERSFFLAVPRRFFRPGDYDLIVYGLTGGREERVATYSLRVPR